MRRVRGSHIVVRKLFEHDYAYFFQLPDGRIFFAIPYERDFTLIGTTDQDHDGPASEAEASDEERSEEHTSELQSLMRSSYAVLCLKKNRSLYNSTEERY